MRKKSATSKEPKGIKSHLRMDDKDEIAAKKVILTQEQELRAKRMFEEGSTFKTLEQARTFERYLVVWQRKAEPTIKAIRDSETLTAEDYNIIVT
jgi:hypothetical protein